MTEVSKEDNDLLKRIVDLTRLHEQDSQIIEGQRTRITALESEVEAHEYNDLMLQQAQPEILRLMKELGR